MDINSLTYGQLKEIAALFGAGQSADAFTPHIGKGLGKEAVLCADTVIAALSFQERG